MLSLLIALLLPVQAGPVTDYGILMEASMSALSGGDRECFTVLATLAREALEQPYGRGISYQSVAVAVKNKHACGKYVILP